VILYVLARNKELDMVFQFDITHLGQGPPGGTSKYDSAPWLLPEMKRIVEKWQTFIDGTDAWTTVFNENHDNRRSVSRFDHTETRTRILLNLSGGLDNTNPTAAATATSAITS
jgi:glycosidase